MRSRYDPGADALYIYLVDFDITGKIHHTVDVVGDEVMVDIDGTGQPLGIEVLWASKGFDLDPVIERFGLHEMRDELLEIQGREFKADLAWRKTTPTA
jgi:uncharacterized protein YuzE